MDWLSCTEILVTLGFAEALMKHHQAITWPVIKELHTAHAQVALRKLHCASTTAQPQ